jgi:WD40 repeat protein
LPIVATGSQDWTIRLWNYETGEELATLVGHEFTIGGLAFTEDARLLVSGAGDETVRLWDVSSITRPGN